MVTGKIIITGIASLEEGKELMNNLKEMIKNVDAKINMKRATKVENMVTTANLNQNLDLQNLSAKIPGSEYDPARFQGLILGPTSH